MSLINCPECGREVSDKAVSCPHCGTPINKGEKKFCQHCGEQIDKECVICPKCGKQVSDLTPKAKESPIVINNNNNVSSSSSAVNNVGTGIVANMISPKSRLVTLLLCLFLGGLGIHRFYVGKVGTGILMIILMFTGIGEIWWVIDLLLIAFGIFRDKSGFRIKIW